MTQRRYFDYAATAPLAPEAAQAMAPYMQPGPDNFPLGANANSLYSEGRTAFSAFEAARASIARAVGARRPDEIIFTGGATESDNALIQGITDACIAFERGQGHADFVPHLVTSTIEHGAVEQAFRRLEQAGAKVTYLPVDRGGFVSVEEFERTITTQTVLASIMMANNEVGSIQPIAALAKAAHGLGVMFHTDAVQAFGKIPFDVEALGVDAASISAHKIGGPKGVGAMYLRARTPFSAFMVGGGQENNLRSGTQNVCGAAGFAAVADAVCAPDAVVAEQARLMAIRDNLYQRLCTDYPAIHATVSCDAGSTDYLPNIVNIHVDGMESETMILRFDMKGIAVSGGSACSAHSLEPSRVLTRVGLSRDEALGSLRISLGRFTTQDDIDAFFIALDAVLNWD